MTNAVVEQIKLETAHPILSEDILGWADTAFAAMVEKAADVEYTYYDSTSVLLPGTACVIENNTWIAGYQFTISASYRNEDNVEVGRDSIQCFLAFDAEGRITQRLAETQIDTFKGTTEIH